VNALERLAIVPCVILMRAERSARRTMGARAETSPDVLAEAGAA
jgi:hypothetical protein